MNLREGMIDPFDPINQHPETPIDLSESEIAHLRGVKTDPRIHLPNGTYEWKAGKWYLRETR